MLPIELLRGLLILLDPRALTDFQRVNRRAAELVNAIPQFKTIIRHAHNLVRGSLSIGTGPWISCETLLRKLCTAESEPCGDFGGYLYLLTCTRVCFLYLSEDKKFLPLRYSHATHKSGVHHHVLDTLPHMMSVPVSYGTCSPAGKKAPKSLALVGRESAYHAGIALHGSLDAMEEYVVKQADDEIQKYKQRLSRAAAEGPRPTTRCRRQLGTEDVFDGLAGNPIRFIAIVRMP